MGGKSRKGAGVSRELIKKLQGGNLGGRSKCGAKKKKITKEDGFGLISDGDTKSGD